MNTHEGKLPQRKIRECLDVATYLTTEYLLGNFGPGGAKVCYWLCSEVVIVDDGTT
jgi:hypothetical protein